MSLKKMNRLFMTIFLKNKLTDLVIRDNGTEWKTMRLQTQMNQCSATKQLLLHLLSLTSLLPSKGSESWANEVLPQLPHLLLQLVSSISQPTTNQSLSCQTRFGLGRIMPVMMHFTTSNLSRSKNLSLMGTSPWKMHMLL